MNKFESPRSSEAVLRYLDGDYEIVRHGVDLGFGGDEGVEGFGIVGGAAGHGGGLGLATIATLYVTPVAYLLLGRFTQPKAEEEARLERELNYALKGKSQKGGTAEPAE